MIVLVGCILATHNLTIFADKCHEATNVAIMSEN
jgi:hypothetical protein